MKRILMACSNYWTSPFQVGSHHLARGFVRAGYEVAFLSDPISPLHLLGGLARDLRDRYALYRQGGRSDLDGRLWTYVPAALLTPHNKPILRSLAVHRHWQHGTWPNVVRRVRQRGFGAVDLLYIDSVSQSFWLDAIAHRRAVFRAADYNPHFAKYAPATRAMEEAMARRVDLVVYPSPQLQGYAEGLGPRRAMLLPNGVDYAHFAGPRQAKPPEYRDLHGPIAVYLGVIPSWFHYDWLRQAAKQIPDMNFVLIGPDLLARHRLAGLPNVHLLGVRDYAQVPAFLQHAQVGLMPFNAAANPTGVAALQPQKMYAYLACGLPVVASDWENLHRLDAPIQRCISVEAFIAALRHAAAHPGDADQYRAYAARFDWSNQVQNLLQAVDDSASAPRQVA